MALKDAVAEIMDRSQEGISLADITNILKKKGLTKSQETVRKRLGDLIKEGRAARGGDGLYHRPASGTGGGIGGIGGGMGYSLAGGGGIGGGGIGGGTGGGTGGGMSGDGGRVLLPGSLSTEEEEPRRRLKETPPVTVPGDKEEFKKLGIAIGMEDPLLDAICNYVFSGDPHDLDWVAEAISGMHLGPDKERRWIKLWQMAIKASASPELKARLALLPAGPEQAKKPARRYTVVGNELFLDPDGDFDTPQQALIFIKAQQALGGGHPDGGDSDAVALARALAEAFKGGPQQTINWAEVMQALKPQFGLTDIVQLVQMMMPAPPPERPNVLSQAVSVITNNPDLISTVLGLLKRGLGLDEIQARLAAISQQPAQPMIPLGEGGLSIPAYKDLAIFDRDMKKSDSEERRAEEAHKSKISLYGDLRQKIPVLFTAAQRVVDGLERPQTQKRPRRQPSGEELPGQQEVMLQGPCPECGTTLTAPKSAPDVECPQCKNPIQLRPREEE